MFKLVLVRHGESEWNRENRFTGWTDVDLSTKGTQEALNAGKILKDEGYVFDNELDPQSPSPWRCSSPSEGMWCTAGTIISGTKSGTQT